MRIFILFFIFTSTSLRAGATLLPHNALIVVHTSRHYHTSSATIAETQKVIRKFHSRGRYVVALGQKDIAQDPEWYSFRGPPEISQTLISVMGENDLVPEATKQFRVSLAGGYHSACLGRALSEILARALQQPMTEQIEIVLPLKSLYTGYVFKNGRRIPQNPEDEAKSDISVDGLNLYEVTKQQTDADFARFIADTLKWSVFYTAPMRAVTLKGVQFQILRAGKLVSQFAGTPPGPNFVRPRIVKFQYVNDGD